MVFQLDRAEVFFGVLGPQGLVRIVPRRGHEQGGIVAAQIDDLGRDFLREGANRGPVRRRPPPLRRRRSPTPAPGGRFRAPPSPGGSTRSPRAHTARRRRSPVPWAKRPATHRSSACRRSGRPARPRGPRAARLDTETSAPRTGREAGRRAPARRASAGPPTSYASFLRR